jgi:hypothetical protein
MRYKDLFEAKKKKADKDENEFQIGDHISYTFAKSKPPKTYKGTIKAINDKNQAQIQWDTTKSGRYAGPSAKDFKANKVRTDLFSLKSAEKIEVDDSSEE